MEVDTVLREISKYSFTKENLFSFLLQESQKFSSFFFYKHMILDILECEKHLEPLIASYYNLEYGNNSLEEIFIYFQNRKVKKEAKELYTICNEKIKKVVVDFLNGEGKYLKDVLTYGQTLYAFSSLYFEKVEKKAEPFLIEYEKILKKMELQDTKMLALRKEKKEMQKQLKNKEPFVVRETKKKRKEEIEISHTYKYFKKIVCKKYEKKIDKKINILQKEKINFQKQIEETFQQLFLLFEENHLENFWHMIMKKYDYYAKQKSWKEILNHMLLQGKNYSAFLEEIYACANLVKNYFYLSGYVRHGNSFLFVCKKIRQCFVEVGFLKEAKKEEGNIRTVNMKEANEFYCVPDFLELPNKIETFSSQFLKILSLTEPISFVKKCSEFHFDFLWIYPFLEENKRTAKVFLALMFASHNIILPVRYILESRCMHSIYQTYGEAEMELLARYRYFYAGNFSFK